MSWWQALILGIVEGLTEYLPVSSTGHLILTAWLLGLHEDPQRWRAAFTFNIVIQAGAIAAVLGLYWRRIVQMGRGLAGRDDAGLRLALNLLVAFLPAAALGLVLNEHIRAQLNGPWPVIAALFLGAWLMLVVAKGRRVHGEVRDVGQSLDDLDWRTAVLIGFGQCVAMWPGTSRSMMTIVAAMVLGLRARDAAEFSFLLGLITLTAATAYEAWHGGAAMLDTFGATSVVVGALAATVSAAVAVRWFVAFLNRYGLAPFGWYRLAVAVIMAALIVTGAASMPE